MASPSNGLDTVALTFAVVLTAAIVLLFSHLMPPACRPDDAASVERVTLLIGRWLRSTG
jgi:hypothetical protein